MLPSLVDMQTTLLRRRPVVPITDESPLLRCVPYKHGGCKHDPINPAHEDTPQGETATRGPKRWMWPCRFPGSCSTCGSSCGTSSYTICCCSCPCPHPYRHPRRHPHRHPCCCTRCSARAARGCRGRCLFRPIGGSSAVVVAVFERNLDEKVEHGGSERGDGLECRTRRKNAPVSLSRSSEQRAEFRES